MLFDIYVDNMGLNTNVNSLIFWVHYSSKKISENETAFKFAALGLRGLCDNGIIYDNSQWYPVRVCEIKIKCSWMHLIKWILEVY